MNTHLFSSPLCVSRRIRASRIVGVLAGLALLSFFLFEALDLDGMTQALAAPATPAALAIGVADPDTDRLVPHAWVASAVLVPSAPDVLPSGPTPVASRENVKRLQMVRPWRLPTPRSAPSPAADPL